MDRGRVGKLDAYSFTISVSVTDYITDTAPRAAVVAFVAVWRTIVAV